MNDSDQRVVDGYFAAVPVADLRERTILLTRTGSHAYGLATPTSDVDVCGVALPTIGQILGLDRSFEQHAVKKNPDGTVFELRKYLTNAMVMNPAFVDSIFGEEEDVLIVTPWGAQLRAMKPLFLSRAAANAWLGYAQHQRKRFVGNDGTPNYKAGMHAVRACRVLARLHREGVLEVRREKDQNELLSIRRGEMSIPVVLSLALHEETLAKDAEKKSVLPPEPKRAQIHAWCMDVLGEMVIRWNEECRWNATQRIRAEMKALAEKMP